MTDELKAQRELFDRLYRSYSNESYIYPDPLIFPRRYKDPSDREVVALISALFALGRVESIMNFLEELFFLLPEPARMLRESEEEDLRTLVTVRKYRFFDYERIIALLSAIGGLLRHHRSIEAAAASSDHGPPRGRFAALEALENLGAELRLGLSESEAARLMPGIVYPAVFPPVGVPDTGARGTFRNVAAAGLNERKPAAPPGGKVDFNASGQGTDAPAGQGERPLPDPRGGAAKRLMLFLRWMVRSDAVDPGGWEILSPGQLFYPLDTHIMDLSGGMGIRSRRSADMKTVVEITDWFRRINPEDPVKYDFALTRLGIRSDLSKEQFITTFNERSKHK